jgi:DNA-binding NarL/FixJ family response regulator
MDEGNSVRVVVQHQNRLVREMLAGHLMREPGIALVGTTPSGPELVQLCNLRRPAVAVFELDTPRWSNDRLVSLLRQSGRELRLVGVHNGLPAAYIIRAYEAGVSALVSYVSGLEVLLEAIRSRSLPVEAARATPDSAALLTERELQVLYLISAGYSPTQVAVELDISQHTVENHKQRIFAKLEVHNQAHAAASAVRLGLAPNAVPPVAVPSGAVPPGALPPAAVQPAPARLRPDRMGGRIGVSLRDPEGRLTGRIRRILQEQRIPLLEGNDGEVGDHDVLVTVLVDPTWHGWPGPEASQGRVVVITSGKPSYSDTAEALSGGVTTVPASRIDDLLVPAIRAAGQGYLLVSCNYVRAVLGPSGSGGSWQRWELALTPREREILMAIRQGQTTKQTARQLGISVRTVENLQGNLFRKLRVHSRAAAVAAAHHLGLLND